MIAVPSARLRARPALLAVVLSVAAGACGEKRSFTLTKPLLTVEAATASGPVDVRALAQAGGFLHPPSVRSRAGRPVQLHGLSDVHLFDVTTDRGRELVHVNGLWGRDPRLPAEVDRYLVETARPALEAWSSAPGATIVESPASELVWADHEFPCVDGHRVVDLQRLGASGSVDDVATYALARGWALAGSPYSDPLAIDPRLVYRSPDDRNGLRGLAVVREQVRSYEREAAEVAALDDEALTLLTRELQADLAGELGWTPREPLRTTWTSRREVRRVLEDAHRSWAEDLAGATNRSRLDNGAEPDASAAEILEWRVASSLEHLGAVSPLGPAIHVLAGTRLSRPVLEDLLVHEIVHQYQEERWGGPGQSGASEAHAAWTAARWARRTWGLGERYLASSYPPQVRALAHVSERTGLSTDELQVRFALGQLGDWQFVVEGHWSLQEWVFAELDETDWQGLVFAPVDDGSGRLVVDVTNSTQGDVAARFAGPWCWRWADPGSAPAGSGVMYSKAIPAVGRHGRARTPCHLALPFNLHLPAGATVRLVLSADPLWRGHAVRSVTGLFSRTY